MNSLQVQSELNTSKLYSKRLNASDEFGPDQLEDSPDLLLTTRTVGGGTPTEFNHRLKINLYELKKKRDKNQKPLRAVKVAHKEVEQVEDAIQLLGASNQLLRKLLKQTSFFTAKLLPRISSSAPSLKAYWNILKKCVYEISEKLQKQINDNEKQLQESMFQVQSDDDQEIKIDLPNSREKTMIELLAEPNTIEVDLSPRSLPSVHSMPMPKDMKDYNIEDLQKVIRELTVKLRKKQQSEILITDPYLQRVRKELSGENIPSYRPSLLTIQTQFEDTSTQNEKEKSFLHNIKDALKLRKQLDSANQKIDELEWAVSERNKQVDSLKQQTMKLKKKVLQLANSKKKPSISEVPSAPRSPKTEDVLRAVQHSLFKEIAGREAVQYKGKGDKVTLERLRKVQEQLFQVTNILKQEINPNDHRVPARLAFITIKLLQDYPEKKQLILSRQLYEQIRETKPQIEPLEFSDILSKPPSLPDPITRFNSDLLSLGQAEEPGIDLSKVAMMEKEDLIYLIQAQAKAIEKQF